MAKRFGPTGEFPDGKIDESDAGELAMGITDDGQNVICNFGTPVMWFGLPPDKAIEFAELIIKRAKSIQN